MRTRRRPRPTPAALAAGALGLSLLGATAWAAPAGAATSGRSTTVAKTFHTNVLGGTTAKISNHGNIVDYLSPDSAGAGRYEHIGVGTIGEGYVLCYTGPSGTVNTFDTGASESGFGPSTTVAQTAQSITVRRNTSDGKISLTQAITFVGGERAVQVRMTLKNNTASPVPGVVLRRQVDFDVDAGGPDGWSGFQNWHAATTRTSVFAFNDRSNAPADKEAHAMQLRFLGASPGVEQRAFVTNDILDTTCGADSRLLAGPTRGDFGDTMLFPIGTLPSRGTKLAAVEYSRF